MNFKEVTSFEIAAQRRKIDPTQLPDVSRIPIRFGLAVIAQYKLMVIFEAVNMEAENEEPWRPDWTDEDQDKYNPWFEIEATEEKPSGVGFSYTYCGAWGTVTSVGSRLCTFSAERSNFIAKQFANLYKDMFFFP